MLPAAPLLFALAFPGRVPMERGPVFTLGGNNAAVVETGAFHVSAGGEVNWGKRFSLAGRGMVSMPAYEPGGDFLARLKADAGQRDARAGFFLKKLDSIYSDYSEQLLAYDKPLDYRVGLLRRRIMRGGGR